MSTIVIQPVDYSVRPLPGQFSFGNRMPGEINVYRLQALDAPMPVRVCIVHGDARNLSWCDIDGCGRKTIELVSDR